MVPDPQPETSEPHHTLGGRNCGYRFHRWYPDNRRERTAGDQDVSCSQRRRTLLQNARYVGVGTRIVDAVRIADALASHCAGEWSRFCDLPGAHCDEISLRLPPHKGLKAG